MTGNKFDARDLLAMDYVLGILPQADRKAVEERIEADRRLADTVAEWRNHFAGREDSAFDVEPPAEVFARIEAELDRQEVSGSDPSTEVRAGERAPDRRRAGGA